MHLTSGVSALVAVLIIGSRTGYGESRMVPHSLPLTITGAGLLWFGWFGFNAGSALGAGGLATSAFVATNTAAAAATRHLDADRVARARNAVGDGRGPGAVAGLVAITPASGYVTPMSALVIGAIAGVVCFVACHSRCSSSYDDSLDVVGVHGAGGLLGALLTGVFATTAINPAGADGLLAGNAALIGKQALGALAPLACGGAHDGRHPQGDRRHDRTAREGRGRGEGTRPVAARRVGVRRHTRISDARLVGRAAWRAVAAAGGSAGGEAVVARTGLRNRSPVVTG